MKTFKINLRISDISDIECKAKSFLTMVRECAKNEEEKKKKAKIGWGFNSIVEVVNIISC